MNMKFYIIDEYKNIIDGGNNKLELQSICYKMNIRLGGNCTVVSCEELSDRKQHFRNE